MDKAAAGRGFFLIEIERLTKVYARTEHVALRDVSLRIRRGRVFGLLGPNGAGKTTLISILAGLVPKSEGRVLVDGLDLDREPERIKRLIGLVPQHLAFYPTLTVRENLEFYAGILGQRGALRRERIDDCVAVADLGRHLDRCADTLSGGLKRRLNLAIGLLNRPALLFLDEPTVGIDPQSRHFILQSLLALKDAGMTIVYTSHYLEEVRQICDDLAIIDAGRIVAGGTLAELLAADGDTLRFELEEALDEAGQGLLGEMLAAPVRREGAGRFAARVPPEAVERLLNGLRERGLRLRSLHYGSQDLERLYLSLTSTEPRD